LCASQRRHGETVLGRSLFAATTLLGAYGERSVPAHSG
jgi:hypothetical protein